MVLNTVTELAVLRSRGRLFQSLGALAAKALSTLVTRLVFGTTRRARLEDLRHLTGTCGSRRSDKYPGARPLRALKVNNKILKLTLK